MTDTHGARICTYRVESRRLVETQINEAVQTSVKQISYCGVVPHHQDVITERRIKELTLGIHTLLLHANRW